MLKFILKDGPMDRRFSKGFSLVEVLVVVAIMAAIAVIGIPAVVSQLSHLRLTRSVRDVSTELQAARLKAIAQNTRYKVEFVVNSGVTPPDTYTLFRYSGGAWAEDPGRVTGELAGAISISTPVSDFTTEFYPNGTATATSICIENTAKTNDRMKITVQGSTGMITVQTGC